MDGFGVGYFVGRRKEQRRNVRDLAAQRDQMEREIRAQYGLPTLPPQAAGAVPVARRGGRISGRMVRGLLLAAVILVVLFVALFAVYAIGYGVQHHLIYLARSQ